MTPSRRALFTGATAAAALASLPAMASPDAELIRLCDRLSAISARENVLCSTVEDDDLRDELLKPSMEEWHRIAERLWEMGVPLTREGAAAVARAGIANTDHDLAGVPVGRDLGHHLLLSAAVFLEGADA